MKTQIFKAYVQNQPMLLPPDIGSTIPENHLVRVISRMVDQIEMSELETAYAGGGTSAYHPKMMMKVIIYAYSQCIYSSRQIAKALRENTYFMWLSAFNQPDFRTINRFREKTMKELLEKTFRAVTEELIELGLVDLKNYYVDGTKIEANAKASSAIWLKNTLRYKQIVQEKLTATLKHIEEVEAQEQAQYGDSDLNEVGENQEITSEKVEASLKRLKEKMATGEENKEIQTAVKQIEKDYLPRLKKYEEQEKILDGRNSYSSTDTDATFMRMKEDRLCTGQLKAAYNVQIGTENQYVIGYSVHQRAGDTSCFLTHMEKCKAMTGKYPEKVVADAGYGSEENYAFLEKNEIEAYVKYNTYENEQKKSHKKKKPYLAVNFDYNEETDSYQCPQGKTLSYQRTEDSKSKNGYKSPRRVYKCEDCTGCPVKDLCTKGKGPRGIYRGDEFERYRKEVKERFETKEGRELKVKRSTEVEAVFGMLKHNMKFRRFMLKGIEKVSTEWGILCLAHNMMKVAATL